LRVPSPLPTTTESANTSSAAPACFRHVRLPAFPEAVRAARRWTRETLEDWQLTNPTRTIEQLVSELLTNSIEHARTTSVGICLSSGVSGGRPPLADTITDQTVLIEVNDSDAARLPTRKSPSLNDTSGRGLLIVEELSDRWGVQVSDHGKTVWCEVAILRANSWPG
jgi:anti-sigma regulatory factor (Ser/Thr protein kinase)